MKNYKPTNRITTKDNFYHVCNKSISNYKIFSKKKFIHRFLDIVEYYNNIDNRLSYSILDRYSKQHNTKGLLDFSLDIHVIKILAYCIMPDHYHLLVKMNIPEHFSIYISKIDNSYSRYFNIANNRKGPLWQSRFKLIHVNSEEQFIHVLRYIHLNPCTSNLVKKPQDWMYSSYNQYLKKPKYLKNNKEISIDNIKDFIKFHEDNIDYQKQLKNIKRMLLE